MCGIQTHSGVDVARELDIHWVVQRTVWDQLDYREVCVNWVQRIPQMMTKLIVWAFLVSIGHVTLIKEGSFDIETWLITQNLNLEKGCVIKNQLPPAKKMETLSSLKMTMVTLWAEYGSHFLQKASVTSPKYCPFA